MYVKSRSKFDFFFAADQLLLLMSQVACRPRCVDRGAGAAAAVRSGRTLLGFFEPKNATDGAKESPVLMDSSSGGGASGDAGVVATGVVSMGEDCAGAGRDADVVETGVMSKGEGGAGVLGRGRGDLILLMAKQRKGVSTYTNIRCCTWRS